MYVNLGLSSFRGGIGKNVNICVFIIGSSGDVRGYRAVGHPLGAMGSITPNAIFEGVDIFEYTWNVVTGEFIISFGDGTEYLVNVPAMKITHEFVPAGDVAVWDTTDTQYDFTDLELALEIGTDTDKSCFFIDFLPELLQRFNYIISTGDGT